jgi:hypothetical protein
MLSVQSVPSLCTDGQLVLQQFLRVSLECEVSKSTEMSSVNELLSSGTVVRREEREHEERGHC